MKADAGTVGRHRRGRRWLARLDGTGLGGMALVGFGNVFPPLSAFVSMPFITHAVGVDGRGDVAAATAPYLLLIVGATVGMPEAMTYFTGRDPSSIRHTLRRALVLVAVVGVVVTVGAALLADDLSDGRHALARLIVIGTLAVTPGLMVSVVRGCAAGLQQWRRVAAEQMLGSVARLAAVVTLAAAGHLTVLAVVLITVLSPLVGVLAYVRMPAVRAGDGPAGGVELESGGEVVGLRPIVGFGSRIWIGSIAGILLFRLDQTVMVPLASVYVLGIYAVAANISEVPLVINNAVRDVTFAVESAQNVEDRLAASARLSAAACGLVTLVLALSLPLWVPVVFGHAFGAAVAPTVILLAGLWLGTPGSVAGAGLSGRGRPGLRTVSLLVALVFNVTALLILTPILGANGAALATLIGAAIAGWLNVALLCRLTSLRLRDFCGVRRTDLATFRAAAAQRVGSPA